MGGGIKDENVPMEAIDNGRDVKPDIDAAAIERIASPTDIQKEQDYSRIDPEVAKYTTGEYVEVSKAESKRLRRLIDTRVLPIMVREPQRQRQRILSGEDDRQWLIS